MLAARSLLFLPADCPRKFQRACASGADALILDLEDAVGAERKVLARETMAAMLRERPAGLPIYVRVNALGTGLTLADLHAAVVGGADGVMLPKCRDAAEVRQVAHGLDAFETAAGRPLGTTTILAIATETAGSVFTLGGYAGCSDRLAGLVWGVEDLSAELGATEKRGHAGYHGPYRLARDLCLMAATAAGVAAIDTVWTDIADLGSLRAEASAARRDGFAAKIVIHPTHVDVVNAAFAPTEAERGWAERIVAAFASSPAAGALQLDGIMIDRPHLRLACRLLSLC